MSPSKATRFRIRDLNDAFRAAGPAGRGQWLLTAGVQAEGADFIMPLMQEIRSFDAFTEDNDPYGEHDFGSINFAGQTVFWKIDYYDLDLNFGSNDPSDPAVTRRVITVMLASEY